MWAKTVCTSSGSKKTSLLSWLSITVSASEEVSWLRVLICMFCVQERLPVKAFGFSETMNMLAVTSPIKGGF